MWSLLFWCISTFLKWPSPTVYQQDSVKPPPVRSPFCACVLVCLHDTKKVGTHSLLHSAPRGQKLHRLPLSSQLILSELKLCHSHVVTMLQLLLLLIKLSIQCSESSNFTYDLLGLSKSFLGNVRNLRETRAVWQQHPQFKSSFCCRSFPLSLPAFLVTLRCAVYWRQNAK